VALPVPLALSLSIMLDGLRVGLPILRWIIRMAGPPFLLAVPADLAVDGIDFNLTAVVIAATMPPTVWLSTNDLVGMNARKLEPLLAVPVTESLRTKMRALHGQLLAGALAIGLVSALPSYGQRNENNPSRATEASLNGPSGLGTDIHGHLFVIEMNTHQVRRIDLENGIISTVAGNGKTCCYKDDRAATAVSLGFLRSLAVDPEGDISIGEDAARIKKVNARTGLISTFAGDGKSGAALDGTTALAAHFWEIDGLAIDAQGNLFVSDGHQGKIFEINAKTSTVRRFAGTGKFGYDGDGKSALNASFRFPDSITVDRGGDLIVADFENCAIRKIDGKTGLINTIGRAETEQNCLAIGNSRPGPFPSDPVSDMAGNVYFAEGAMDLVLELTSGAPRIVPFAGNGNKRFQRRLWSSERCRIGQFIRIGD